MISGTVSLLFIRQLSPYTTVFLNKILLTAYNRGDLVESIEYNSQRDLAFRIYFEVPTRQEIHTHTCSFSCIANTDDDHHVFGFYGTRTTTYISLKQSKDSCSIETHVDFDVKYIHFKIIVK